MACKNIKNMLSEFLDNALDEKNRTFVAAHLSSCNSCREALEALEKLSLQLQQLPSQMASADFLDRLHQKMRPAPWWKKLYTALFIPFKIKIPLELATATAVAVLAFFVFTVQQQDTRLMESAPVKKEIQLVQRPDLQKASPEMKAPAGMYGANGQPREKRMIDTVTSKKDLLLAGKAEPPKMSATVRKELPSVVARETDAKEHYFQKQKMARSAPPPTQTMPQQDALTADQTAAAAPEAITIALPKPIELALFMNLTPPMETFSAVRSKIAEESKTEVQNRSYIGAAKEEEAGVKGLQSGDLVSKIKDAAAKFGGKLVYIEHDPSADTLLSLQINIPSSAYDEFCDTLAAFGTLRTPKPKLGENPSDPLSIKLYLY